MRRMTHAFAAAAMLAATVLTGSPVLAQDTEASPAAASPATEATPAATDLGAAAGGPTEVGVILQEWAVIPETTTLAAGSITFNVENIGPADPHELVIVRTDIPGGELPTREDGGFDEEGEGVEVIGEIEEFAPGTTQSATFDLAPGHYVFLCNLVEEEEGELEAHYRMGMWVDVEVT